MILQDTLLIGDQTTLSFKTTVPKGTKFIFPTPANPVTEGVEIVGTPSIDTISNVGDQLNLETKVVLTSFDSGSYALPKFPAYLNNADGSIDTIWFDGGQLNVTTIQIDTTTYKPFDIKDQLTYPYTVKEFIPWFGLLVLLTLLGYLIVRFIKNRKQRRSLFGKPVVADPPHIVALRNLEKIRSEKLWQNNQEKLYYTNITDTLRVYLEQRFNIQTMEKTSSEILDSLSREKIEPYEHKELKKLLNLSDLVKFAKYKATAEENENAIPTAVRFVNATFLQKMEQEKIEQEKGR
ncbi:MAG: hypothetical protein WCX48_05620 [Bacteroidales bacterium]